MRGICVIGKGGAYGVQEGGVTWLQLSLTEGPALKVAQRAN
jgi:hypothetical protein